VGAAVIAASISGPTLSQGTPQTVTIMKVDPSSLTSGYRTSKVVGSAVVNEANETVGTVDDLIVTPSEKVPFAVLSVGGFLGMGTKYVVVPYSSLQVRDKKMMLPDATKDSLKALPCRQASRNRPSSSKPCGSRPRMVARSKRKPSMRWSSRPNGRSLALNSLNRAMGLSDLYPFVLSTPAIAKLGFVHELVHAT
jgi:hypothetical protein